MADGTVLLAWVDNGQTRGEFTQSVSETVAADQGRHLVGYLRQLSGVNVAYGRNQVVKGFLDHPDKPDWLWFVDADMSWTPEQWGMLFDAADPKERPIIGGVCVGAEGNPSGDIDTFLTVFTVDLEKGPARWNLLPPGVQPGALLRVHGTGGAFILIHRSVLEAVGEKYAEQGFVWFAESTIPHPDGRLLPVGEDVTFCIRAVTCGYPTHVHTGVQPKHHKGPLALDFDFHMRVQSRHQTTVVMPVKDNFALTQRVLTELKHQGGWDRIFVFDNGSKKEMRNWLSTQTWLDVFDAEGMNIHEMWNLGLEMSLSLGTRINITFLNNDLKLGPLFLPGLAHWLRRSPTRAVVSPNYDGRDILEAVQPVAGIAGNAPKGEGGMCGYAFMLKAEWVRAHRYRFPTEAHWWYGDTDLAFSVTASGWESGVVRDVTVEHVHGGSQTERPAGWDDRIALDAEWFHEKWADVLKAAPA